MLVNNRLKFLKSSSEQTWNTNPGLSARWGLGWIKKARGKTINYFPNIFSCCNFNQDQLSENRNYWDKLSWTSRDVPAQGGVPGQGTATSTSAAHAGTGLHSSSQDRWVFPKQHLHMEGELLNNHENLGKVEQRYLQQCKRREGSGWGSQISFDTNAKVSPSPQRDSSLQRARHCLATTPGLHVSPNTPVPSATGISVWEFLNCL